MGNVFEIISDTPSVQYLYTIDHYILTNYNENKHKIFFTNILGVICYLKYSKHQKDKNIKLIIYKNKLNLYALDDEQKKTILTVFPSLDKNYVNKKQNDNDDDNKNDDDDDDDICKEIKRLDVGDLNDNMKKVKKIENIFGSYIKVDMNKKSIVNYIEPEAVHDFNINKFLAEKHEELDKILRTNTSKETNQQIFDNLLKNGYLEKANPSDLEEIKNELKNIKNVTKNQEIEKLKNKIKLLENYNEIDGRRRSKRKSKSRRRSKRKSKSRRSKRKLNLKKY
jgi:hypothetical protein